MAHCIHHPDQETGYHCQKHQYGVCEACVRCEDPRLHCRFRSRCPIRFLEKEKQTQGDP